MKASAGLVRWIVVDILGCTFCVGMWLATQQYSWLIGLVVAQVLTVPLLVMQLQRAAVVQQESRRDSPSLGA